MDTLPQSNAAIEGGTNGATDGASMADLKQGYCDCTPEKYDDMQEMYAMPAERGGFLGRPQGWER